MRSNDHMQEILDKAAAKISFNEGNFGYKGNLFNIVLQTDLDKYHLEKNFKTWITYSQSVSQYNNRKGFI